MNFAVVILGIIVFVLLYVLYLMYSERTSLAEKVDLKENKPEFPYTTLSNPRAVTYSYSMWIFVNSWSSLDTKNIFSRYPTVSSSDPTSSRPDIRLYLEKDSPKLKLEIKTTRRSLETIPITDNFPIQKWVHVIVSVDNQIVDAYIDGKLVMSRKLTSMPVVSEAAIKLGQTSPLDIFLSKFNRGTKRMDPNTALDMYNQGNGMSSGLPDYGMKLTILKDNIDNKNFRLF
jgi:hypothetical protein